ncbi:hypothetical protein HNR44_001244 [Geomicrobium halophilum]|uniref:Flagellar hook-length control protein-like C-terminal domain-containing protein n=1 Tax=Geomicrobium halophilum TaxID=549000 RepID=A0A841PYL5_9BACL|nr:flagellar hook-length control protein FliK [Geomicrobium halophilum]MBB6449295.1 hypothetical protein [Geomicrobium halophilum]
MTHSANKGSNGSFQMVGEESFGNGNSLFNHLLTHIQDRTGGLFQQENGSYGSLLDHTKALSDWKLFFPSIKEFLSEEDWGLAAKIIEETVREFKSLNGNEQDLLNSIKTLSTENPSIDALLEQIMTNIKQEAQHVDQEIAQQTEMEVIPTLAAILAFAVRNGESERIEPLRHRLSHYLQVHGSENVQIFRDKLQEHPLRLFSGYSYLDSIQSRGVLANLHRTEINRNGAWEGAALPRLIPVQNLAPAHFFTETVAAQPLNQGQQLFIHLGGHKTNHARAIEFVKQFQQAIRKGHLRMNGDGVQRLTVKLHPETLGRVDVQITRENGLMQARMLTTTNTTRELVEAQLPQLRNAFLQQQLAVDRIIVEQAGTFPPGEGKGDQPPAREDESQHDDETGNEQDHLQIHTFEEWLRLTMDEEI